ncbi:hypothetical protein QMJ91_02280 [Acinetobacter baumannii]|uniref:hypothetical protein n=1 Tax=Acinetobacter calcoaceticus/baumannii complex TaxID=909768 RepID=UPI000445BCA1|nr:MULTISPECIES: hypothetical protein [Acinetobacter calcoaceticus/baumannii complex]EXR21366.1 hypothetical protein J669_1696 [Acinetobacter baumannii 1295549]EXR93404.1 hypothetical protein J680_0327 [Acinetobacter baumannii 277047]EXS39752.1 hypothetical protein J677_0510 [Acinetobacter baumannii 426863]MCZ3199980.1 hypothetical protein [Acinetobacter baumannii]MDI7716898.1 hypothetical protein [Acinetobacter baumannii]
MQQINKVSEPTELTEYKRKNPTHRYDDLGDDPEQIRLVIRKACLDEQAYLCAYCCRQVGIKDRDCMNEHILPRHHHPQYSFDFNNIVASCTTKGCCDDAKENQEIAINPLSPRCETEFKFNISGTITGLTDDAKQTIDVLKLGDSVQQNQKLVDIRKQVIANFLFIQGTDKENLIEDDELLTLLIDDLKQLTDGKLQPFAPVISKALQNWVNG